MIRRWLDFLYPPVCELCEVGLENGSALCDDCLSELPRINEPFCQNCGEAFDGHIEGDFQCPNCIGMKHDFDFARAPLKGINTAFHLVHALKYRRRFYLAHDFGKLLMESWEADARFRELDPQTTHVVPVPLHWRRQQWRQGNQAHEIAREFVIHAKLPLNSALKRIRQTSTQTKLSRKQRLSNLRGAFVVRKSQLPRLRDSTVILIDDVFTTGATAHECAKALKKQAQVKRVIILTLVRG